MEVDALEEAMSDLVRDGNMVELVTIQPDGSAVKSYRLTDKGMAEARDLIERLAAESENEPQ